LARRPCQISDSRAAAGMRYPPCMISHSNAALVLSGGGALGAAHLGALRVFEERGFAFDSLYGVSAGAIVAALIACGQKSEEIFSRLKEVSFFSLAFDFKRTLYGLVAGDKIKDLLEDIFAARTFDNLAVRLAVGATDFQTGEQVMIRRGRLADAVRASISVPVVFEPFYHPEERRWLVDGGLSQNFPLDAAAAEYPGERIIAVDVASRLEPDFDFADARRLGRAKRMAAVAQRTVRVFLLNQQRGFPADPRVLRIDPPLDGFTAVDAFKLDQIREIGERAAREALGII